jgi:single-strand DNA-binding protein
MVNKVFFIGNLTRDPELKHIPSGTALAEVGLAVNTKLGKDKEETLFVDLTLWGRSAEVASEYLTKGSKIHVEGRLKLETWENNEGQKRSKHSVVVDRFQMLDNRGKKTSEPSTEDNSTEQPPKKEGDDEIPF